MACIIQPSQPSAGKASLGRCLGCVGSGLGYNHIANKPHLHTVEQRKREETYALKRRPGLSPCGFKLGRGALRPVNYVVSCPAGRGVLTGPHGVAYCQAQRLIFKVLVRTALYKHSGAHDCKHFMQGGVSTLVDYHTKNPVQTPKYPPTLSLRARTSLWLMQPTQRPQASL